MNNNKIDYCESNYLLNRSLIIQGIKGGKAFKLNTVSRVPLTISLLDETGKPTMVWTVANAWPTKITGTDLIAEGNEVVVESIEIAHEGVTIA